MGDANNGGSTTSVSASLVNVVRLRASRDPFLAIRSDNSVIYWGSAGEIPNAGTQTQLNSNVLDVLTTIYAFQH